VIAALTFLWWLLAVFFWVVFLTLTMTIARSKGHSPLLWGLLAVFLPLITVIIVLLLPPRTPATTPNRGH
jgi:Na+-translocating ferredoxin:NAD+ oxidoreductase RnfA subunit